MEGFALNNKKKISILTVGFGIKTLSLVLVGQRNEFIELWPIRLFCYPAYPSATLGRILGSLLYYAHGTAGIAQSV
jgi:hypothetical protein